jgi:alpha/beta superfamily hydrolase
MAGQATPPPLQTEPQINLRYILISPPISSFVGFLLTPFRSAGLATSLKRILAERNPAVPDQGDAQRRQVLIVYGGRDNFTSMATYRQWISGVLSASESKDNKITTKEISEADHFWSNLRCKSEMLEAISTWL